MALSGFVETVPLFGPFLLFLLYESYRMEWVPARLFEDGARFPFSFSSNFPPAGDDFSSGQFFLGQLFYSPQASDCRQFFYALKKHWLPRST